MKKLDLWIRKTRIDQKMEQKELAAASGLAGAQVSRIENSNSDLTINAIVRLCYALGLSLQDVLAELEILSLFPRLHGSKKPLDSDVFFTIGDIEAFFVFNREEPDKARQWLIDSYQAIRENMEDVDRQRLSEFDTAEVIYEATRALSDRFLPLPYPRSIAPAVIENQYTLGGLLSIRDLGAYVRGQRQKEDLSLRRLSEKLGISFNAVSRLERGELERASFTEIVNMDAAMHLDGSLIAVSWAAGEFQTGVLRSRLRGLEGEPPLGWQPQEMALADTLLAIARWYAVLLPDQLDWWQRLKHDLGFYAWRE